MGLFQSSTSKHQAKLAEEYLYGVVADEIANRNISPGLWAKALAEAEGNEQKAKARYIKLRVDLLKTEGAAIDELARLAKAREEAANKPVPAVKQQAVKAPQSSGNLFGTLALLGVLGYMIFLAFGSPGSNRAEATLASVPTPAQQIQQPVDAPSSPAQYEAALRAVLVKHPELNPDLPGHQRKLIEQVETQIDGYTRRGYTKVRALEIAIWDMESGAAPMSAASPKASQKTRTVRQNTVAKPHENDGFPDCIYKGVMSADDYRACGLNPPSTR